MKTFLSKILCAVTLALLTTASVAGAQIGITSLPVLELEPDSRAAGMGIAGTALADDASAVYWNPAGLGYQEGREVGFTHASWLPTLVDDMSYNFVRGKYHVDGIGTVGLHLTYLDMGEQQHTNLEGDVIDEFSSNEMAIGASYGIQVHERFSVGTGLRFIHSNLATGLTVGEGRDVQSGTSFGIDLAGLYQSNHFELLGLNSRARAGINLSNMGPSIAYTDDEETQRDPLPTMLRLGWSVSVDLDTDGVNTLNLVNDFSKGMARLEDDGDPMNPLQALFSSWDTIERHDGQRDVSIPLSQQIMVGMGAEYWYDGLFALRTGYFYEAPNNGDRRFLTLGAGLRYQYFGADFSYLYTLEEDHPLNNTIRLSAVIDIY